MSEPILLRSDHGTVSVLTLNRPDQRNALSRGLIARLSDELARLAVEPQARAIVVTGAGTLFCAGMDLKEASAAGGSSSESEKQAVTDSQAISDVIQQIHSLPKATIAALNGDAYAGGAGLASACDFVIAAASARVGYPEVRRGLVPAIVMHDLVRQVGARRARFLVLTGEPITAEEAERWGLVNRVVPPEACLDEAIALGRSLTACAPIALATAKRLLDEASGYPKSLRGAAAVTSSVRVSEEAEEGMRAFVEKRPPRWTITSRG